MKKEGEGTPTILVPHVDEVGVVFGGGPGELHESLPGRDVERREALPVGEDDEGASESLEEPPTTFPSTPPLDLGLGAGGPGRLLLVGEDGGVEGGGAGVVALEGEGLRLLQRAPQEVLEQGQAASLRCQVNDRLPKAVPAPGICPAALQEVPLKSLATRPRPCPSVQFGDKSELCTTAHRRAKIYNLLLCWFE